MGQRMVGRALFVVWGFSGAMAGCGGSSNDGTGYDATYDCQETIACQEKDLGPAPAGTLQKCVDASSQGYANADANTRERTESAFGRCRSQRACDYVSCVRDALGLDTSVISPDPQTCEAGLQPQAGTVSSSAGDFAFSAVEARFWVSDAGCLTEIDVELKSGPCSVEFDAAGLLDQDGKYLITTADIHVGGLCPGYPDGITTSYLEIAKDKPFGTIEIQRENASWSECKAGTLVIRPEVVLSGALGPDITFSGVELQVSGNFSRTHYEPTSECPTVFF